MELFQWFCMGILFTLSVQAIAYLSVVADVKWYALLSLATGCAAILFGIGWAGASFLEGISQSGAMALIFFCAPGIILITLTWRFLVAPDLDRAAE